MVIQPLRRGPIECEDDKSLNRSRLTPGQSVPLTPEMMATPLTVSVWVCTDMNYVFHPFCNRWDFATKVCESEVILGSWSVDLSSRSDLTFTCGALPTKGCLENAQSTKIPTHNNEMCLLSRSYSIFSQACFGVFCIGFFASNFVLSVFYCCDSSCLTSGCLFNLLFCLKRIKIYAYVYKCIHV